MPESAECPNRYVVRSRDTPSAPRKIMESTADADDAALVSASATIPQPGPTLLPTPVARTISLATRSTSFAIRVGSLFGSYSLDAAKFTTLSSLELARGVVEGILVRAGRDVTLGPRSELATADAETILERSLEGLHHAVSQVVFWTSASFHLTGTTLFAASELSQVLLSSLDQLFGSTDSSRAIASIVTLIRREFNNPATGDKGEKVGVVDLILALSALAYLQRSCRKALENERKTQSHEEVIWDVVVVDDGERVDVHDESLAAATGNQDGSYFTSGFDSPGGQSNSDSIRSVSLRQDTLHSHQDDEQVLARLKGQIASSLSPGTAVNISSSVSTTQTITVDVHGPSSMTLPTPPGAEIVETRRSEQRSQGSHDSSAESSYRVVYKIHRNKLRNTSFQRHDEPHSGVIELGDDSSELQWPGHTQEARQASRSPSPVLLEPPIQDAPNSAPSQARDGHRNRGPFRPTKASYQRSTQGPVNIPSRTSSSQLASSAAPKSSAENAANQKKLRTPLTKSGSRMNLTKTKQESTDGKKPVANKKSEATDAKHPQKKGGFKQALKGSSQSISSMWNKDQASPDVSGTSARPKPQWKAVGGNVNPNATNMRPVHRHVKSADQRPQSRSHLHFDPESIPRSSSRASYVSIHERRRDSIVSQTDSYSVRTSGELRPASPTVMRTEMAATESLSRQPNEPITSPPLRGYHRRSKSHVPSIYSLGTNDSQASLILSSYYQKSAYNTSDALNTLRRAGAVEGTFPSAHLLQNISRYMRFSSASYGSNFLRLMGISSNMPSLQSGDNAHHDVRHFLHHTGSGEGNILLASFVDPGGGSDSTGSTESGMPLVHYISLDHEAKAVVLACRGTLGFEDVLADLTCDYDRLIWRGRGFRVHKGIHASARRILYGGDGRVLITLQEALREFPDYGLVLCGHSLGGAVTSLLGVMLSEPNPNGTGFVTASEPQSKQLTHGSGDANFSDVRLPAGRPVHVFAYGPPGAMSVTLCNITKGLITTVIHGGDIVPHLSLGVLHDFQAVAVAFKKDDNQAKVELRQRMWQTFQNNVTDRFYRPHPTTFSDEDQLWMLPALESLRGNMDNEKLMPPGEVFCIDSQRVLRRDAFLLADERHIGRPARRIVLRYVKDVQSRFREVRFGTSMLIDHSPAKYEAALNKLRLGVAE